MAAYGRRMGLAGITRRRLLGGALAGAATLALGSGAASRRAGAELATDILVVGGGVGGVAAALAAARLGRAVTLTEETDWLGGQLTTQAVPPDENPWIETTGCTASYRAFRDAVRRYYRENYPLRQGPYADPFLNPGMGLVSAICHEPRVALAVLDDLLKPYVASGRLTILLRHRPKSAALDGTGKKVLAVTFDNLATGATQTIQAPYILDATDLGDLLPLALTPTEYVTGAESRTDQGTANAELHALAGAAQPLDQQAISWCFPLEYLPGEDHTIDRPADYTFWRDTYRPSFWTGSLLSWTDVHPETLQPRTRTLFDGPTSRDWGGDMWHFRRIFWHDQCLFGLYPSDITLVNWPQIDYWRKPLVGPGVTEADRQTALAEAKGLSLAMLYWMQKDAPRHDRGVGYPGLRLRPDLVGTGDGLAKVAYVRESRRIKAEFTVLEKHVGVDERRQRGLSARAEPFPDSVGVGYYRIDLHPSTGGTAAPNGRTYVDVASYPFQIPLGALIPQRVDNLLPAAKNIGTTHVTNGCYRLHPVEWAIGEAAGALAAFCLGRSTPTNQVLPRQVRATPALLADFQRILADSLGFVLAWPAAIVQEAPDGRPYGGGG